MDSSEPQLGEIKENVPVTFTVKETARPWEPNFFIAVHQAKDRENNDVLEEIFIHTDLLTEAKRRVSKGLFLATVELKQFAEGLHWQVIAIGGPYTPPDLLVEPDDGPEPNDLGGYYVEPPLAPVSVRLLYARRALASLIQLHNQYTQNRHGPEAEELELIGGIMENLRKATPELH